MLTTLLLALDARERSAFHLEPFSLTWKHFVYSFRKFHCYCDLLVWAIAMDGMYESEKKEENKISLHQLAVMSNVAIAFCLYKYLSLGHC